MRKVFAEGPSAATVGRISVGIVLAMALSVLAIGWWKIRPAWRARRRYGRGAMAVRHGDGPEVQVQLPDDPVGRLCARFAQRLAIAEKIGLLPGARALSCGELHVLAVHHGALAGLAQAAPVVERARYAPTPPDDAELAAADAQLAALELGA